MEIRMKFQLFDFVKVVGGYYEDKGEFQIFKLKDDLFPIYHLKCEAYYIPKDTFIYLAFAQRAWNAGQTAANH
jgi:hypothetical protein